MLETKATLNDSTLEALQGLIEVNIDSAQGLREAASAVDHGSIGNMFLQIARNREQHVKELKSYVNFNGEKPEDSGSLKGKAHRTWLQMRSAINAGDPQVVLNEAERGEDIIKAKYEKMLTSTAGSAMNDVLMRQYSEVKKHHDLVRDLRDAY